MQVTIDEKCEDNVYEVEVQNLVDYSLIKLVV